MDETVSHGVGISLVTNWITWPKRSWLINFTEIHEYHSQSKKLLWMFGELWTLSLGRGRKHVGKLPSPLRVQNSTNHVVSQSTFYECLENSVTRSRPWTCRQSPLSPPCPKSLYLSQFKINSDTSDTFIYPIICSTYCKIEITVPLLFRNSWLTSPVYLYNETQNKIKAKTNIV